MGIAASCCRPCSAWVLGYVGRLDTMGAEDLSSSDQHTLTVFSMVVSTFSVAGSALIITSFLLFPNLRKFSYKLVVWLSVADLGNQSMSYFGNPDHHQIPCKLQAFGMQFFSVSSFLWTGAIAYVLRSTVIDKRSDIEGSYRKMHAIIWALAAFSALLPSWAYGPTGAWCWIASSTLAGKIMRFLCYYCPLWVCIGYNSFAYISVIRFLRRVQLLANSINSQDSQPRFEMKAISRLGWYPSILIFTHIWGTINRIQNWVEPHHPSFTLFCLHTATSSSMGFLNCIAYGLNNTVRAQWVEKFPFLKVFAMGWLCGGRQESKFQKMENEMGAVQQHKNESKLDESSSASEKGMDGVGIPPGNQM